MWDREWASEKGNQMIRIVPVKEPYGFDFYVYKGATLVRVCPSEGMANEVAAGL